MQLSTAQWLQVQTLRQFKNGGPATARNRGLRAAMAADIDVVMFLDNDCIPAVDWVHQMLVAQTTCPGIVGGMTRSTKPHTLTGTLAHCSSAAYKAAALVSYRMLGPVVCIWFRSRVSSAALADISK